MRMFVSVLVALGAASCEDAKGGMICHCPAMLGVQVFVPKSRVSDVTSVKGTGTCEGTVRAMGADSFVLPANGADAYALPANGDGTCHVVVWFRSAPAYSDDVSLQHCHEGACCASCGPFADHVVTVPDLVPDASALKR